MIWWKRAVVMTTIVGIITSSISVYIEQLYIRRQQQKTTENVAKVGLLTEQLSSKNCHDLIPYDKLRAQVSSDQSKQSIVDPNNNLIEFEGHLKLVFRDKVLYRKINLKSISRRADDSGNIIFRLRDNCTSVVILFGETSQEGVHKLSHIQFSTELQGRGRFGSGMVKLAKQTTTYSTNGKDELYSNMLPLRVMSRYSYGQLGDGSYLDSLTLILERITIKLSDSHTD